MAKTDPHLDSLIDSDKLRRDLTAFTAETDGNGDNAGRVSVYSVNDSPPVALCKNVTVALDETATATIGVNTIGKVH